MIEIYEGNNAVCSNIYNRYLHIIEPYKIPKRKYFGKRKVYEKENPILIHKMAQIIPDNYTQTLEFKILDKELIEKLKNIEGEFLLDRYIVEWKSKKYFLNKYNSIIYKIEGDIVVIFSKMYQQINEVVLDRENKLNALLTKST